jgi:subtilisin family serine protease
MIGRPLLAGVAAPGVRPESDLPTGIEWASRTFSSFGHTTGRGVAIYVFDGGIFDAHPEVAGRVRRGFDAFPADKSPCNSHATAVAGAAAGRSLGLAPDAEIVDVKIIDCRSHRGSVEAIVRATQWAIEDHERHPGERAVVNWSFVVDTSHAVPEIDSAVARLRAAGMVVVVAAGNFDLDACRISPANAPGALVVGAMTYVPDSARSAWREVRLPHTAWGACVDAYAPGDSVRLPAIDKSGAPTTRLWSGSSMSAGYASGAAALLFEQDPSASPDRIAQLIRRAAP